MLRIGICEDAESDQKSLRSVLGETAASAGLQVEEKFFTSGEDLLERVDAGEKFDLLMLDIYLTGINGIETARQARERLPDVELAFLTISREFAAEAFELDAVHYITKPVREDALRELFLRLMRRGRMPERKMTIQAGTKEYQFPVGHVVKVLSSNKGVDVYLEGESHPRRIAATFSSVEQQLDPSQFLRISRGFVVNMDYIARMDNYNCSLKDGTQVLVSRRQRPDIRRRYNNYLFDRLGMQP